MSVAAAAHWGPEGHTLRPDSQSETSDHVEMSGKHRLQVTQTPLGNSRARQPFPRETRKHVRGPERPEPRHFPGT